MFGCFSTFSFEAESKQGVYDELESLADQMISDRDSFEFYGHQMHCDDVFEWNENEEKYVPDIKLYSLDEFYSTYLPGNNR